MSDYYNDLSLGTLLRREIEAYRERIGERVTQEQISADAEVSRKHLSEILNDKSGIEADTLGRLLNVLKISGAHSQERIVAIYSAASLPLPKTYISSPASSATDNSVRMHSVYMDLDDEDQEELIEIARLKWRLKHPDSPSSPRSKDQDSFAPLPKSRVQYDLEEHKLYTHDGHPAEEDLMRTFLLDVGIHIINKDIEKRVDEERTFVQKMPGRAG